MNKDFWQARWAEGRIGFHLPMVNPNLVEHKARLLSETTSGTVLVPLCGKTLDLIFLKETGLRIIGIEIVEQAIIEFFQESKLDFIIEESSDFKVYKSQNLEFWHGDIFDLEKLDLKIDFIFDRASIVALEQSLRDRYAGLMNSITSEGCRKLLLSFDYNQNDMSGPPFSVPETAIRKYYEGHWLIEKFQSTDIISKAERFAERGLKSFIEEVYLLERNGTA